MGRDLMSNENLHRISLRENFSLLTFLETEKIRLQKLLDLLEEGLPQNTVYENSSQWRAPYQKQLAHRDELKKALIKKISAPNSPFVQNIQFFFDQIF